MINCRTCNRFMDNEDAIEWHGFLICPDCNRLQEDIQYD